jgi:hypothetical protein
MYLGIVIQNNDPEFRGRVKVYVPHIQANVYQQWYSEIEDRSFRFLGDNIKSELNKILPELKTILPWAENAMPAVGASGSGRYNAHDKVGTISDSNRNETVRPNKHQTDVEKKYGLNDEHIGEKPGKLYENHSTWVHDAFTNTEDPDWMDEDNPNGEGGSWPFEDLSVGDRLNGVNRPNKYAWNYRPTTYSNCAKGSFSIPNVGSHVWVFFQDGDPLRPVVFAASFGQEDWKGIYDSNETHGMDYPGTYENVSKDEEMVYNNNTETYRSKYVINQKGGTLEFVNTDNREILKLTHYSGSFYEFNNHVNIQFASKGSQKLVQEDEYDTVKGFRNVYTERDLDFIVKGDVYKKIGYLNFHHHLDWREKMHQIAQVKGLFEIKRVEGKPGHFGLLEQQKQGQPIKCPVCNDTGRISYWRLHNKFIYTGMTSTYSSQDGAFEAASSNTSQGYFTPTNNRFAFGPGRDIEFEINPNEYKSAFDHLGTNGNIFGESCPACGGSGMSPSSMEGEWQIEESKSDQKFTELIEAVARELAPIESKLGLGGSEITSIAKHKIENIGLVMNNFPSIRTDPLGKMYRDQVKVHKQGVFVNQTPSPLIEPVHVDDLPGGSYSLNVANRWNVHVGAGGIAIKTHGRVEIGGSQISMAGDQVNIGSQNEINIDGGKRLNIVSDIISIRQRKRGQVLVDSNLGVSQNVVIGGGLHVEGELSCHHITAPVEIHETERARIYSKLLEGLNFTCDIVGGSHVVSPHGVGHPLWTDAKVTLTIDSNDDHVVDYGHSHLFKNAAMHLMETNDLVRETGKDCNVENSRADANKVEVVTSAEKVKKKKFTP